MVHEPQTLREAFEIGGPVMWPLLGASVIAVAVVVERAATYASQSQPFERFVGDLTESVRARDLAGARRLVEKRRSPIARLAAVFLDEVDRPKEARSELLRREGGVLIETVEKRLPILRLIVQIAPILGLLGTVHGLLFAFWGLEAVDGPIRPSDVAGGIGSALTTTVFGLSIAIPSSAFLLWFEEVVDRVARRMGFLVSHLEEALDAGAENAQPSASERGREDVGDSLAS